MTEYTFNGDLHAYLDTLAIPSGQISERMIAYVSKLDATVTTASGAMNYALNNIMSFSSPKLLLETGFFILLEDGSKIFL